MQFREYREEDAKTILTWIKDEKELRYWSADRYGTYPISAMDINKNYAECRRVSNFYPFTLEDDGKVIGHLILRNPREDKKIVRLGFIIVDRVFRGKGYGKKIISEAIRYAREKLGAEQINLGVFTNNQNAFECYKACGFKVVEIEKNVFDFNGEKWDCAEMVLEQ